MGTHSLLVLLAILIVLAVLACVASFSDSERFGWIGRVVGIVVAGGIAAILLLGLFTARAAPHRQRCVGNLSQIGKAVALYASDQNGQLPGSFAGLTNYLENPKLFRCPDGHTKLGSLANIDVWTDYILVTNANPTNSTHVLAYCNPSNHAGGANVLFVDCSVQWVNVADFPSLGVDIANLSRVATNSAKGM